jgi:hypothetical protein
MRLNGRRKKKLLVAFHFQFSSQAAWNCDECSRNGLTQIRNCGFENGVRSNAARTVWARRSVSTTQCPKSIVTSESLSLLEQFQIWKRFGSADMLRMNARAAEAFVLLDDELQQEIEAINRSEGRVG